MRELDNLQSHTCKWCVMYGRHELHISVSHVRKRPKHELSQSYAQVSLVTRNYSEKNWEIFNNVSVEVHLSMFVHVCILDMRVILKLCA